jgi:hypothetical protein
MNKIVESNVSVIHGLERIGSVGDLRIRYLAALSQGERTRIWVVGCFDNPSHHLYQSDVESNRSELYALVWRLVVSDVRATMEQAIVYFRKKCHRKFQRIRHSGK